MKVGIKKPEKVELYKMEQSEVAPLGIFDDTEEGLCGLVESARAQLDCEGTPDALSSFLCNILNGLGTSFGCYELDPGECNVDADCMSFQECVDGICTTPEGVCFDSEECTSPEVCQDMECCLPAGEVCVTSDECCGDASCLGILSTDNEGVKKNIMIEKHCSPLEPLPID